MAKPTGFMDYERRDVSHRPAGARVKDYFEIDIPLPEAALVQQAARCMDCGIPFCHGYGCPLGNQIPEFNDLIYNGRWREANEMLHSTNNFPEITGRICPAPCEASCTLSIGDNPVLIKHIECQIVERAFAEGWIVPMLARHETGRRVAIIGSGPGGLAAAQQLARKGDKVVVFEKDEKPGGILRYGIPDFKLDKSIIDRRLKQMTDEGVEFQTSVTVGKDISARYLRARFDAICLAMGAGEPRNLTVEGRELENVHFAMDYLTQQNRVNDGVEVDSDRCINASGKTVVVIGGGDTGSDCVGTARRQGAEKIYQFEILPKPPVEPSPETPWPQWPLVMRESTSQEEGCTRRWCILTKKLTGAGGRVTQLHGVKVEWVKDGERFKMVEKRRSMFTVNVDMVLLAMGFVHVAHKGLIEQMGLELDQRGNVVTNDFQTSEDGVFAAGDSISGASLVVRAIKAGRDAAEAINRWLEEKE